VPTTGAEMRRRLLVAALLLALVPAVAAGCGQQTDPQAQQLLKDASAHLSKAADVTKSIKDFNQQWQALVADQANPQTAAKLEALLTKTKVSETASLDELKAARDDYAKAVGRKISSGLKKYVDLRSRALDEQEQFLKQELQAMDLRISVARGVAAGDQLQTLIQMEKKINDLETSSAAHLQQAGRLYKQASDYYKEHNLGGS